MSGIERLRALLGQIDDREENAKRIADLIKNLKREDQKRIRVAAIYCPKGSALLEVFHVPPPLTPDHAFLVVPSSATAHDPYWVVAGQDYPARCRCCHNREVVLTTAMLVGESPPPEGYRIG